MISQIAAAYERLPLILEVVGILLEKKNAWILLVIKIIFV